MSCEHIDIFNSDTNMCIAATAHRPGVAAGAAAGTSKAVGVGAGVGCVWPAQAANSAPTSAPASTTDLSRPRGIRHSFTTPTRTVTRRGRKRRAFRHQVRHPARPGTDRGRGRGPRYCRAEAASSSRIQVAPVRRAAARASRAHPGRPAARARPSPPWARR